MRCKLLYSAIFWRSHWLSVWRLMFPVLSAPSLLLQLLDHPLPFSCLAHAGQCCILVVPAARAMKHQPKMPVSSTQQQCISLVIALASPPAQRANPH
jgi:hypothetical protein